MKEKKFIFICVEDRLLQFTLTAILIREGYEVVSQSWSQLADFCVLDDPVDLLILEPSEHWDELWNQKLNKIRCQFAKQPILILSARLPGLATFDCEDFGFCKIIQTPAQPVVILESTREMLM